MLGKINAQKHKKTLPCILGTVVGYKSLPEGRDAIIIRRLDENLKEGALLTITQGAAHNDEAAAKRRTIESYRNVNSKHYAPEGSILQFDQIKISDDETTAEAVYIKDLWLKDKQDQRTILVGHAKPLPSRKDEDKAWVEVLLKNTTKEVSTARDFAIALMESWRNSVSFTNGSGITRTCKSVIILTDDANSAPVNIFINNVKADEQGNYRLPTLDEVKLQIANNSSVRQLNSMFADANGQTKLKVSAGFRIFVPPTIAQDKKYSNTIKFHTGTFKVNVDDALSQSEEIGYRKSVISLWQGCVNMLTPFDNEGLTLNGDVATKAIRKGDAQDKTSISAEKAKQNEAALSAGAAFDKFAASQQATTPKATQVAQTQSQQTTAAATAQNEIYASSSYAPPPTPEDYEQHMSSMDELGMHEGEAPMQSDEGEAEISDFFMFEESSQIDANQGQYDSEDKLFESIYGQDPESHQTQSRGFSSLDIG